MPSNDPSSGLRRPFRVVRWLGDGVLDRSPQLVRMLHESRAQASAREKLVPVTERPAYHIRQARFFARGRDPVGADETAVETPGAAPQASPPGDGTTAPD